MELRATVLLSLQRALLGEVSAVLRGVTAGWDDGGIDVVCYFDGPISDADEDSMGCVSAEIAADFPPEYAMNFDVVRKDAPAELPVLREWVYRRREDSAGGAGS